MNTNNKNRVCPVEHARVLDRSFRKLLQNPKKILKPYIINGMKVLDFGCGPGFFTLKIAKMVGKTGKVIAADLQQGMLDKLKLKIQNSDFENIISLYKTPLDKIGLSEKFDFILIFYVLHEVPDQFAFLKEVKTLLKSSGKILIAEPKFRVSKEDFANEISLITRIGFEIIEEPKIFYSRSIVIK